MYSVAWRRCPSISATQPRSYRRRLQTALRAGRIMLMHPQKGCGEAGRLPLERKFASLPTRLPIAFVRRDFAVLPLHYRLTTRLPSALTASQCGGSQSIPQGDSPDGAMIVLVSLSLSHAAHQLKVLSAMIAWLQEYIK